VIVLINLLAGDRTSTINIIKVDAIHSGSSSAEVH